MEEKLTFEQAMEKLEETVAKLENAKGGLEDTVKLYEEGVRLAAMCNTMIDEAQQKITILSKTAEGFKEESFVASEE
ncbi:MAG: exodeoxyribonuclease VII small subunit [Clostridia bacterium]|nr:exodeoxyribonuclease VII small subunit [Clostridia bacterium]